jgi:CRISPR-associated RAMP protein, csm3 family
MYAKIQITGKLEVVTGMHIGGGSAFAAIGAVDLSVIKDTQSKLPMIPGSSLKGKMRTLLAKSYNDGIVEPDNDAPEIIRVFGSAKKGQTHPSRIIVADMIMSNKDELHNKEINSMTEVKFENSISRQTAVANPRQIERVIRGAKFDLDIIYEVEVVDEVLPDMRLVAEGLKLLQFDYLGGHGSRGYGKVKFNDVCADVVIGDVDDNIMAEVKDMFAAEL